MDRTLVPAVFFCLGFLAVSVVGGQAVASLEALPSERIGAQAFLFLLSLAASAVSTVSYVVGFEEFRREPRRLTSLFGGVVAAAVFSAAIGVSLVLALVLPSATGWLWSLFGAGVQGN